MTHQHLVLRALALLCAWFSIFAEANRLQAALKAVLGHLQAETTSPASQGANNPSIRRLCMGNILCEQPGPTVVANNVAFMHGKVYANEPIPGMSHLPAQHVQLKEGTSDWIPGPEIIVDRKYAKLCDWGNPDSPANKATVFVHPWEINNAFHALHDNVLSVIADVIMDYLHSSANSSATYTLYQFQYFRYKKYRYVYYQFNHADPQYRPSLLYELLPIVFGRENIRPVSRLLSGGPHCVKHMVWGTAKKPFYTDTLVDLRKASYDVLHHILQSYTNSKITAAPRMPAIQLPVQHTAHHSTTHSTHTKPSTTHKPRVIIVSRASTRESSRKMNKQSEQLLAKEYEKAGFTAEVCCDFSVVNTTDKLIQKFQGVDVCVGVHGAGLANCILGRRGITIIELQTHYAYGSVLYQKLAHMASGQYIFYDIRLPIAMNENNELRKGYLMSSAVMSDMVDISKRMYLHAQRTAMIEYTQLTTSSTDVQGTSCAELYSSDTIVTTHNKRDTCTSLLYTTPAPTPELVIIDYKKAIMYAKPNSTFATHVNNIMSYNIQVGNITAWDQLVKLKNHNLKGSYVDVLNRNYRTYWVQLSPSVLPYSKASILGPNTREVIAKCKALQYYQFRQVAILLPSQPMHRQCDDNDFAMQRSAFQEKLSALV